MVKVNLKRIQYLLGLLILSLALVACGSGVPMGGNGSDSSGSGGGSGGGSVNSGKGSLSTSFYRHIDNDTFTYETIKIRGIEDYIAGGKSETLIPLKLDSEASDIKFTFTKGINENIDFTARYIKGNIELSYVSDLEKQDFVGAVFGLNISINNRQTISVNIEPIGYSLWRPLTSFSLPNSVATMDELTADIGANIIPFHTDGVTASEKLLNIDYGPITPSNTGISVEVSGDNPEAFSYRLISQDGRHYISIKAADVDKSATFTLTTDSKKLSDTEGEDPHPLVAIFKVKSISYDTIEPEVSDHTDEELNDYTISSTDTQNTTTISFNVEGGIFNKVQLSTTATSASLFQEFATLTNTVAVDVVNNQATFTLTHTTDSNVFVENAEEVLIATLVDDNGNPLESLDGSSLAPTGSVKFTVIAIPTIVNIPDITQTLYANSSIANKTVTFSLRDFDPQLHELKVTTSQDRAKHPRIVASVSYDSSSGKGIINLLLKLKSSGVEVTATIIDKFSKETIGEPNTFIVTKVESKPFVLVRTDLLIKGTNAGFVFPRVMYFDNSQYNLWAIPSKDVSISRQSNTGYKPNKLSLGTTTTKGDRSGYVSILYARSLNPSAQTFVKLYVVPKSAPQGTNGEVVSNAIAVHTLKVRR